MADVLLPAPRKTLKKLKDMGDGTVAPVVVIKTTSTANAAADIILSGSFGTRKRLRAMGDGTHAEVVFLSSDTASGEEVLLAGPRGTYQKLELLPDGSYARVLSSTTDDGPDSGDVRLVTQRHTYKKLQATGKGYNAEVLFGVSHSAASSQGDVLIPSPHGTFKRLRDMGDGTHAEVVYVPNTIITTPRVLITFGDSFMAQHTANANRFESVGPVNVLNMMSGQRFTYSHALNFGVSGNNTDQMVARLPSVLASCQAMGVTDVVIMAGANDRTAKYTAQKTKDNYDLIQASFQSIGLTIWWLPCLQRRDQYYINDGFTPQEMTTAKDNIENCNAHLASKHNGTSFNYLAAVYTAMTDPDRQIKAECCIDLLHLTPLGAMVAMENMWPQMIEQRYGCYEYALKTGNVLVNTTFAGTGGTLSGATGVLAAGHASIGSAPAGTASRTFSKTAGDDRQLMVFNFPSGGTNTDNMRISNRMTASHASKTAFSEMEIDLRGVAAAVGSGIWRTLSLELLTSAGSLSIGNDRAGTADLTPVARYREFCIAKNRTMLLRSPAMTVPTSTYIEHRLNIEANTINGALAGSVKLLNEQIVVQ